MVLLLTANVVYLGYELDRQASMELGRSDSLPVIPLGVTQLKFLDELGTLPPPRTGGLQKTEDERSTSYAALPQEEDDRTLSGNDDGLLDDAGFRVEDLPPLLEADESRPPSCFTFGPVAEAEQASGLANWFLAQGAQARSRHTDEQGRQLFWVYLSPQESRDEAMETIRDIRKKGISDFRLIVRGDMQNAISMGVFSSQASVNKRLGELKKQGYKPVVVPYSDGKRLYWVDTRLPGRESVLDRVFSDYPSRFNSIPASCEEIAIVLDSS